MSRTVWIICQYAGSPRHGMNYRPYYIGRGLQRNGYHVCIISGSYSHQYIALPDTTGRFTIEEIDGLTYCWVKTPSYRGARSLNRLRSWAAFSLRLLLLGRKFLPHPDVIIVSSPMPFPIINGYLFARRYHAGLVFEVRDIWPLSLVEIGGASRLHPLVVLLQAIEVFAYRVSDRVVSVLPRAHGHMQHLGLPADRFAWIPNGITEDLASESASPSDGGDMNHERPFTVGYAGSLNTTNGLSYFVEAAAILRDRRDIAFEIIGLGEERAQLEQLALDREARVKFLPPVGRREVQRVLQRYDACFIGFRDLRLWRFGLSSTKFFDYMLAGKPIIEAINPRYSFVTEIGCGMNARPENAESIAAAVVRLSQMKPEERAAMGARGRVHVLERYRYESLAAKYVKLLDGISRRREGVRS